MTTTIGVVLIVVLAVLAANLPFLSERLLGVMSLHGRRGWVSARGLKAFWVRCLELLVLYAMVGWIARLVEGRIGGVAPQGWEFYVITASLFVVFAYPGFVYRYLRRSNAQAGE